MTKQLSLRSIDIPSIHRFAVGFDDILEDLISGSTHQPSVNYPPYNIIKYSDNDFDIQLAVAGFGEEELKIQVENNVLTVVGEKPAGDSSFEAEIFLHRGISTRNFTRSFTLAEHVEVVEAKMTNGILSIRLERKIPEEKKPKTIAITFDK